MTSAAKLGDNALDALGNSVRRELLIRLADGPLSVGDLASGLPISRPAVSRHLAVLKRAGLVTDRIAGTARLYELDRSGFAATRQWLESFWSEAEIRFRLVAENTPDEPDADND